MNPLNTIPHYQTSFRVVDEDKSAFLRLKSTVHGWLLTKEKDKVLRTEKREFFQKGEWTNLFGTRSNLRSDSFLGPDGGAWAIRHTHPDAVLSKKRFWSTNVGLTERQNHVLVSVRVSYAWNAECLSTEREEPAPSVPKVLRSILAGNHAYSGRREFKLIEKPIPFHMVGMGKPLAAFIQAEERRYPLIVINGDDTRCIREASSLAFDLTGKCQVAMLSSSADIQDEFNHFMPEEYRVSPGYLRVYFPFGRHNNPNRHRWSELDAGDYPSEREGIVHGLLRHHALIEQGAVESIQDIDRLVSRDKLGKMLKSDGVSSKELAEFYRLFAEVEQERDNAKREAQAWAAEVDAKQTEIEGKKKELHDVSMQHNKLNSQYDALKKKVPDVPIREIMTRLPTSLTEVLKAGEIFFDRLEITPQAYKSAAGYEKCKCIHEAWEILSGLNNHMYELKFEKSESDLEGAFQKATGYELTMCESSLTQRNHGLMNLRQIHHNGRMFEIIPHVKFGTAEPRMLRIHFAFDKVLKHIVIGYVGPHLPTAGTRRQS